MHSDSAIIVMKFSVKPNAYTAMNAEITAIGSVRPVITVLRQLCRNRNTIAIVSSAPSISVRLTPDERVAHPVAVGVDQLQLDARRQRSCAAPRPPP